ncbi:hypothetical protein GCM10022402_24160 [Salinactinospora qingdaonensis]|uniref:Uncharacterized protein n=1 Tax=Salinactinospora qingdaonensis TaxID=702744 RepID=A0ABP7FMM9_9ACTN
MPRSLHDLASLEATAETLTRVHPPPTLTAPAKNNNLAANRPTRPAHPRREPTLRKR